MKTAVQRNEIFWQTSGSLAASGSITSGSITCDGFAKVVGIFISSASLKAGSGLRVSQSTDTGANFDYHTDYAPTACSGSAFSIEVTGDAVKIDIVADSEISEYRTIWSLRPI